MKLSKNTFTFIVSGVILAVVSLGCGGGSGQLCTAEIAFDGKKYKDIARSEERAKTSACTKYCIEGDPFVGAVYKVWAEAQIDPKKRQMSIYEAMRSEKTISSAISACTQRCLVDIDGGRLNMEMTCR